jgi:hypothetical protein
MSGAAYPPLHVVRFVGDVEDAPQIIACARIFLFGRSNPLSLDEETTTTRTQHNEANFAHPKNRTIIVAAGSAEYRQYRWRS